MRLRFRLPISIFAVAGFVFGYLYFFNQFWTHLDTANFTSLIEYTGESGTRIRGHRGIQILVHQEFYSLVLKMESYAVKHNLYIIITQSYRSPNKKVKDAIVTPAVRSNHLAGHAIDFNLVSRGKLFESKDMIRENRHHLPPNINDFLKAIQLDKNMRWGGDFKTQDPIHIDDELNLKDPKEWEKQFQLCFADYVAAKPKWKVWVGQFFN